MQFDLAKTTAIVTVEGKAGHIRTAPNPCLTTEVAHFVEDLDAEDLHRGRSSEFIRAGERDVERQELVGEGRQGFLFEAGDFIEALAAELVDRRGTETPTLVPLMEDSDGDTIRRARWDGVGSFHVAQADVSLPGLNGLDLQ